MKLREIFEASKDKKHVVFCFGRMNPPHYGHGSLITKVQTTAGKGDWFIFTSKSQDPKKNPLPYRDKLSWLHALFPALGKHLVPNPEIRTYLQAAAYLYAQGYTSATFIAGDEDMELMQLTLEKYNGVESKHGVYNFQPLQFVTNPRETSATSARQAAISGNEEAFAQATQVSSDLTVNGLTLFQAVRQGMGLEDEPEQEPEEPTKAAVAEGTTTGQGTKAKGHTAKLEKSMKASMKNMSTMPDQNQSSGSAYLGYRMGLALAGAPTFPTEMAADSWLGGDPLISTYSDEEFEMVKAAAKQVGGGRIQNWSGNRSKETADVNKTSAVAKPKKNKYGV